MSVMLARSTTFRYLLALLIALWTPFCLCQAAAGWPGEHGAASEGGAGPSPRSEHRHSHDSEDHSDNRGSEHHNGCPDRDHRNSGCECPQLTAALAKAEQSLKGSMFGGPLAAILSWMPSNWLIPAGPDYGCSRPGPMAPRPPTSLLRLHCALTI